MKMYIEETKKLRADPQNMELLEKIKQLQKKVEEEFT